MYFSYDQNLWNGVDIILEQYESGKESLNCLSYFFQELLTAHEQYSKRMEKVLSKIGSQNFGNGTLGTAWDSLKYYTIQDITQHKKIASRISNKVLSSFEIHKKERQLMKDSLSNELVKIDRSREKVFSELNKREIKYNSLCQEMEIFQSAMNQHANNQQKSKEVFKIKEKAKICKNERYRADKSYKSYISEVNDFKNIYEQNYKRIFSNYEELDRRRIGNIKIALLDYSNLMISTTEESRLLSRHLQHEIDRIDECYDVEKFIIQNETFESPDPPVTYVPYEPGSKKSKVSVKKRKISYKNEYIPERVNLKGKTIAKAIYDFRGRDVQELTFSAGNEIEISEFAIEDLPGWMRGSINDNKGYFPSSFVEIHYNPPLKATVVFSFESINDTELSVNTADTVLVHSEGGGWIYGENSSGNKGLFPSSHVCFPP